MNKKIISAVVVTLTLLPVAALAFSAPTPPSTVSFSTLIDEILGVLWVLAIVAAAILFIIAAFFFITSQGDPGKVATARQMIIWGVVGIIVAIIAISLPFIIAHWFGAPGGGANPILPPG